MQSTLWAQRLLPTVRSRQDWPRGPRLLVVEQIANRHRIETREGLKFCRVDAPVSRFHTRDMLLRYIQRCRDLHLAESRLPTGINQPQT